VCWEAAEGKEKAMTAIDRRSLLKYAVQSATLPAVVLSVRDEGEPPVDLDIGVLRLQAGDLVILTAPGSISEPTAQRLKQAFESLLPTGVQVAVMGDGLKVDGVLRRP
jgi:hypothetical protein